MFCAKCGGKNINDAIFCVKCGADLTKQTPPEKKRYQDSLDGLGTSIQKESEVENFQVGSLFANRYEILSEGLRGGMGVVYKCKDTMLNKIKALKVIHPRLLSSKQATSRFRQEVAISQELNHENIVRVYDIEEWEGKEYFTMEWVEGVTLREIITERKKEKRPFTIEEAQKIITQLAEALEHAHRYTIHRDIKPENILVTNDKELQVKLTDFGIAKMLSPSQFTSTSMQMGTPYYMAPEQKVDAANVDKRADIYALGVVFFELLTLENTIGFELPSEINKTLPKEIDNVIRKAVATKPEDRYGDVKEFSEALSRVATIKSDMQQKKAEEQKEEAEKARVEAERKKAEEWKREQAQRQMPAETTIPQKTTQKSSLNKVAFVVAGIVLIIVVAYIYNSKKETLPEQPLVSQKPAKEPYPVQKKQNLNVIAPETIKNRWYAVKMIIKNKETDNIEEIIMKLNSEYIIPGTNIRVEIGKFLPDFRMDVGTITSASNEPNNPAVSIKVFEGNKEVFKGWLYAKFPSIKPFQHPKYSIIFKEGIRS